MSSSDRSDSATPQLRERLYGRYVSSGKAPAAEAIGDLESRAVYLRRLVERHFPPDRRAPILELGCGHGALVHVARLAGYEDVRGVDVSREQVEAAARLGVAGVVEGDLLETLAGLSPASCQAIVAFDVLEHLARDELLRVVDGVHAALEPGGRFIVHVPNGESPFFGAIRHGDLTHELAFTRDSLAQLLVASGFREVRCHEDTPVVHGAKSAVRWALWKLIRAGLRLYVAAETGDTGRHAIFTRNLLAVALK